MIAFDNDAIYALRNVSDALILRLIYEISNPATHFIIFL